MLLDRTKRKITANWWWTIDRYIFSITILLLTAGFIMTLAASPRVANRIGLEDFYFVKRQMVFIILGFSIILSFSLFKPLTVRRLAAIGYVVFYILLASVEFIGSEIKGAHRWISFGGITVQPSEILKPFFAVLSAWLLTRNYTETKFRGFWISLALLISICFFTIRQPDFGMSITFCVIWFAMAFVAGMNFFVIIFMGIAGVAGAVGAYVFLPHVQNRINSFLNPEGSMAENYQTFKSIQAFESGGVFGTGPAQGKVKEILPDAHTDFIFSVAGEEFGMLFCLGLITLFGFFVVRCIYRAYNEKDLFSLLAITGLSVQIFMQAAVNMAVAVNLIPNKGMTLPFISYGGSSMVSVACAVGMILAFTRKKYGN